MRMLVQKHECTFAGNLEKTPIGGFSCKFDGIIVYNILKQENYDNV